ncbi:MAG: hypothetical protein ABIP71_12030 [Verrucomicrobiota bacterium]
MKTAHKFLFCLASVLSLTALRTEAAQSERLLTISLSGFFQDQDVFGNDKAFPFRATTKDFLEEISIATGGLDFTNGLLVVIESLTDTNLPSQIVARKGINQVDVTDLFTVENGEDVHTSKYVANSFRSATFYAIDQFKFETMSVDTNGVSLDMQLFSKETQRVLAKAIGTTRFDVISSTIASDGNGELHSGGALVGPVKGTIKIGAPRFVP